MSVGLLLVRLLYRFYVCVHLSKWFTFCFCFGCLVNVRSVVLPLAITSKGLTQVLKKGRTKTECLSLHNGLYEALIFELASNPLF